MSKHRGADRHLRVILYTHLAIVALTVTADTQDVRSRVWSASAAPVLEVMLQMGMLAAFICPLAMLICVARASLSVTWRLVVVALESTLTATHFVALLPMVQ